MILGLSTVWNDYHLCCRALDDWEMNFAETFGFKYPLTLLMNLELFIKSNPSFQQSFCEVSLLLTWHGVITPPYQSNWFKECACWKLSICGKSQGHRVLKFIDYLLDAKTITGEYYTSLLDQLKQNIRTVAKN